MNRALARSRTSVRLRRFAAQRPMLIERIICGGAIRDVHARDFAAMGMSVRLLDDMAGYPRTERRRYGAGRVADAMGLGDVVRARWAGSHVRAYRDRGTLTAYVDGQCAGEWRFG